MVTALAAGMWVGGVGARLAFALAASNGAGPAIARFSVAHHITGSAAWVAALVMMALADVLTRLVVICLRGRRLAGTAPAVLAPVPAGVGGLIQRPGPPRWPTAAGLRHDLAVTLPTNHAAWASALSAAASRPGCRAKSCHMRGHRV
jgi:hypothetical protein